MSYRSTTLLLMYKVVSDKIRGFTCTNVATKELRHLSYDYQLIAALSHPGPTKLHRCLLHLNLLKDSLFTPSQMVAISFESSQVKFSLPFGDSVLFFSLRQKAKKHNSLHHIILYPRTRFSHFELSFIIVHVGLKPIFGTTY